MRTTAATSVVALATAALTFGLAGTANADLYGIDDPSDTSHGSDILSLQFRNGDNNVRVNTIHQNLRRDPATGSGGTVYFDTDRDDRGPEFVFTGGYFDGTDYVLLETEGFGDKLWGDPVEHGDYIMRLNYRKDTVRIAVSRPALGNPDEVRVAVRASGSRSDGTTDGLTDWVGDRRELTPWLAKG